MVDGGPDWAELLNDEILPDQPSEARRVPSVPASAEYGLASMSNEILPERPLLEMNDIVVRFGSLVANDHIDFDVHRGEVHALLGENGAGKTTLMKALIGLVETQSGRVFLHGQQVYIQSPATAMSLGIGMVHQHFMLIPTLTVAQNVCIGLRSAGFPFPDLKRVSAEIRKLVERFSFHVNPDARVADLSVGAQQRVEIIKTLYRGANLLILDEPTSVLTPQETDGLFNMIRGLAKQGNSIIFISHKLNEVMAISQRTTVLRHGKVVATRRTEDTSPEELAHLMVGREIDLPQVKNSASDAAPIVVKIDRLKYTDDRGIDALKEISLNIHAGEIHGIAGVDGNGQDELARTLAGLLMPTGGKVWLDGRDITRASPAQRIRLGLAHIPSDRQHTGLVQDLTVSDNSVLEMATQTPYSRFGFLDHRAISALATELVESYDIRCRGIHQKVGTLSGGNQQKLILARELFRNPRFTIAAQPTHGLDIGSTEYVRSMLIAQAQRGCAILLISTELDEVLALSHRITVMYEGQNMGTFRREAIRREELGLLMAGKQL